MISRKNQAALTQQEWTNLIDAINKTHGIPIPAPRYRDFVKVHMQAMDHGSPQGMSWGVHSMGRMMPGRNFLTWHRQFLVKFEKRLRKVNTDVFIPYWDAIANPVIPPEFDQASLLNSWGVTRAWDPARLPSAADLNAVSLLATFGAFQTTLEATVHNAVHNAVGGDMASSSSVSDPLFWLHHANIDRLWAEWEATHPGQNPPNPNEILQPRPFIGVKVSRMVSISALGYEYV